MLPEVDEDLLRDFFSHCDVVEDTPGQTEDQATEALVRVGQGTMLPRCEPHAQFEVCDSLGGCPLPAAFALIHCHERTDSGRSTPEASSVDDRICEHLVLDGHDDVRRPVDRSGPRAPSPSHCSSRNSCRYSLMDAISASRNES